jgi:hypothetical protein
MSTASDAGLCRFSSTLADQRVSWHSSRRMAIARFQQERFVDWIEEALPLLRRHWHELAHYPDIPLDIDRKATRRSALRTCCASTRRAWHDKLVGYAVFIVGKNGALPRLADGEAGRALRRPADRRGCSASGSCATPTRCCAPRACNVVYQHVKLAHPALGRVLEHLGYEPIETLYGRRLDKNSPQRPGALGGEDANARAAEQSADETDVRHVASETCH